MINVKTANEILDLIKSAKHALLLCHEKPDGDTLGASLALAHFLEKNNISYKHFSPDKPPLYFSYLPKIEKVVSDLQAINLQEHDLIVTVDCADFKRTALIADLNQIKKTLKIINIDHHQTNTAYGHYNLVYPDVSSTSEIVYHFFNNLRLPLDKYMATCLLTGILTDTMNFTNAATTKESLEMGCILLNKGGRINQIISCLSQSRSLLALKLWGKILSQLQFNQQYNFVYTIITQADLIEHQTTADEVSDGLANFLSAIKDVAFILVLTEQESEFIKGSLRTTKNSIEVTHIAKLFNGGGHQKAAGFKLDKKTIAATLDWKDFILNAIITKLKKDEG